jgi:hypothetical protein
MDRESVSTSTGEHGPDGGVTSIADDRTKDEIGTGFECDPETDSVFRPNRRSDRIV